MKLYILPILLVAAGSSFGQAGAGYISGGGNLANNLSNFSLANNPAAPALKQTFGIYGQNRFTGTSIVNGGFAGHISAKHTKFGLHARYAGTSWYYQSGAEIAMSQSINDNFIIGFSAGYTGVNQGVSYGNKRYISGKIGFHSKLNSKTDVAGILSNPWQNKNEFSGQILRGDLAISHELNIATHACLQLKMAADEPAIYGLSISHNFQQKLQFILTVQNGSEPISAGMRHTYNSFHFEFASSYHIYLGFAPAFSLKWDVK